MEEAQTGTARIGHVVRTRTQEAPISLPGLVLLVVNNKANGMIHRLSEATGTVPRDQRRAHCGWRAGSVAANARFCRTRHWPPFGASETRLCCKCFPSADVAVQGAILNDDPITD